MEGGLRSLGLHVSPGWGRLLWRVGVSTMLAVTCGVPTAPQDRLVPVQPHPCRVMQGAGGAPGIPRGDGGPAASCRE